jgi:hypothetical protein
MNLSDLVDHPRVKKHAFGACGFASVNVSSYSDIPGMFENRWALTGISGRKLSVLSHLKNPSGLLPTEVSEGSVGLSHFVSFLAFFNNRAGVIVCVNQFHGQGLRHGRTFPRRSSLDYPTKR